MTSTNKEAGGWIYLVKEWMGLVAFHSDVPLEPEMLKWHDKEMNKAQRWW